RALEHWRCGDWRGVKVRTHEFLMRGRWPVPCEQAAVLLVLRLSSADAVQPVIQLRVGIKAEETSKLQKRGEDRPGLGTSITSYKQARFAPLGHASQAAPDGVGIDLDPVVLKVVVKFPLLHEAVGHLLA
ncbi:MAG: hypothetical protein VW891_09025, partial [Novosphingobium sp.]